MLKTTRLSNKLAPSKNNGSKPALNRSDNSKPVFRRNNGNGEINRYGISKNGVEHIKKSKKLFKSGKSKSKKMSKSQNLAKLG